jgi:murein DD-endopeptidase MepM/ murein hydrolase activator NlpD
MKFLLIILTSIFFQKSNSLVHTWNTLEKNIRDNKITEKEAKAEFSKLIISIKTFADSLNLDYSDKWKFPVNGYNTNTIGKGGFQPSGYNFFDGNKHGGHAAYDIFVYDNNQDCIDDKTKKPVQIIAPVDLLILSSNQGWENTSQLRGGNYIFGYNSKADVLIYFAHLDSIKVAGGAIVKKGETLATLGRTGKNAYAKRSPTHLHLMALKIKGDQIIPFDYFKMISNKN